MGLAVRDETIRSEIRHMVMDHLLPIVTNSEGISLAKSAGDLERAKQHLRSRAARIQERIEALDEVSAVYVRRETGPIAKRWSTQGVPKMMLGLVMGKKKERRRRVKTLQEANAKRPATKVEATA
jgi:hypothetical protein